MAEGDSNFCGGSHRSRQVLLHQAWEASGSGWAATVTEQGWKLFHERRRGAHRLLDEAIELGVEDGEAYARLVNAAMQKGTRVSKSKRGLMRA